MDGDRHRDLGRLRQMQRPQMEGGAERKGQSQGRKAETQEPQGHSPGPVPQCLWGGPACGSEPEQPKRAWAGDVACRRGLLQALPAPGSKFSPVLEGSPVAGRSPV